MGERHTFHCFTLLYLKLKKAGRDFPGGAVVKNPPANVGNTGSSPGPGRSHMPWSNYTHVPQLLSLCSIAREPQLLKPARPRDCAPQQEKPPQ